MALFSLRDVCIGTIGLGYVGMPLVVCTAGQFPVVDFDINKTRIADLRRGIYHTNEVKEAEFAAAKSVSDPSFH